MKIPGKECYAVVKAFNTFENLLLGRFFIVCTDHLNLLWMQHSNNNDLGVSRAYNTNGRDRTVRYNARNSGHGSTADDSQVT